MAANNGWREGAWCLEMGLAPAATNCRIKSGDAVAAAAIKGVVPIQLRKFSALQSSVVPRARSMWLTVASQSSTELNAEVAVRLFTSSAPRIELWTRAK